MVNIHGGWIALIVILCVLAGAVAGYFLARLLFKRELKKNPPINEKMIRAMFRQMGRTASEAQIRQVMLSMEQANNNSKPSKKNKKK